MITQEADEGLALDESGGGDGAAQIVHDRIVVGGSLLAFRVRRRRRRRGSLFRIVRGAFQGLRRWDEHTVAQRPLTNLPTTRSSLLPVTREARDLSKYGHSNGAPM